MKTNARAAWDAEQIARAVGFTTSRFRGVGVFETRRFDDLAAALADAQGDRRALVYAITPEGWTIHIVNGDKIPKEPAMNTEATTKTYSSKSNAIRAARAALKGKHRDALAEVHFRLEPIGDEFAWHEIDLGTGQIATGELLEDGATEAKGVPPITVVPAKGGPKALPAAKLAHDTRSPKRRKADEAAQAAGFPNATRMAEAKQAEKAAAKAAKPKAEKPASKRAEVVAAAERGELPTPPDFSADTHKRFRPTLEALVAAAKAGNLKALKEDKTEPKSSSRQAICRYRDLAITALTAQAKVAKAA